MRFAESGKRRGLANADQIGLQTHVALEKEPWIELEPVDFAGTRDRCQALAPALQCVSLDNDGATIRSLRVKTHARLNGFVPPVDALRNSGCHFEVSLQVAELEFHARETPARIVRAGIRRGNEPPPRIESPNTASDDEFCTELHESDNCGDS